MLSVHKSFIMDDTGYINLISCLESMTPFEAIRQAEEINKVNGFEVVSKVAIAGWKREAARHFVKIKTLKIKPAKTISGKKDLDLPKGISKIKKCPKPKGIQYQKAYMKLLS